MFSLIIVIIEILLISAQAFADFSCQVVYPSEYAYQRYSVLGSERSSANCRPYASGLSDIPGVLTDDYTHCDGSQLRLTDSDLGSEQYSSSDYYVWNAGSIASSQLLFIFPTRVNLSTITLHYYSNNSRGLPRLRFYVVPDDYNVWTAPTASYRRVDIAAVPSDGDPAGCRNVSVNFNTKRILMYKFSSSFIFSLGEVEFFTQCNESEYSCKMTEKLTSTTSTMTKIISETKSALKPGPTSSASDTKTGANTFNKINIKIPSYNSSCYKPGDTALAWALFGVVTVLFIVLLTVNMMMVALCVYKKREVKGQTGRPSEFEIEGNPCYEATQMKQTTETETPVYETVQGKRGK